MKIRTIILLGGVSLGALAYAFPFLPASEGVDVFATGTVSFRADDNIFLSKSATSDTIFNLTPGLELTVGKDTDFKGTVTIAESFSIYSSHTNLNTNLFSIDGNGSYSDGKMKLNLATGYHELNQNTVDNRGLTRRNIFNAGGNGEIEVSQITSAGGGIAFNHTSYHRAGYISSDDYTLPLNLYYKWTPKVDLSVGYQFHDYEPVTGASSKDNFFNVGARGEFDPKLKGNFRVGYFKRTSSRGVPSATLLGVDATLDYAITPKSNLVLTSTNQADTSPQGAQQKNFTLGASVQTALDAQWSVKGGLNYRAINYGNHTDDYVEGILGANYVINTNIRLLGEYIYRDNSSKLVGSQFTENVFTLAANLRY